VSLREAEPFASDRRWVSKSSNGNNLEEFLLIGTKMSQALLLIYDGTQIGMAIVAIQIVIAAGVQSTSLLLTRGVLFIFFTLRDLRELKRF
jgi:hypothetical protein